ncbi:MAG: YmaF [Pelosinus sp.]|nr:YmaF [Pelosinus sp.]
MTEVTVQCQAAAENTNHNHAFITIADVARGHQHGILGTTGPAIYSGDSHVHRIFVKTTTDPKGGPLHWHFVDVTTGPAIDLAGGEHTHQFCGETSVVLGHDHRFNSVTDAAPDQEEYNCN